MCLLCVKTALRVSGTYQGERTMFFCLERGSICSKKSRHTGKTSAKAGHNECCNNGTECYGKSMRRD